MQNQTVTDEISVELTAEEVKIKVNAKLDEWGIVYNAEFVPQSLSRNAGNKDPQLNWKVMLGHKSRLGKWDIVTDYSQGIGHLPDYNQSYGKPIQAAWQKRYYAIVAEQGKYVKKIPKFGNGVIDYYSVVGDDGKFAAHAPSSLLPRTKDGLADLPSPDATDVLYSLVLDSEVIDCESFEDWADNFGYDHDSRSAEKIYRSCLETALKMRSLFGEDRLRELRVLFENY
jgi:hypothetical protein